MYAFFFPVFADVRIANLELLQSVLAPNCWFKLRWHANPRSFRRNGLLLLLLQPEASTAAIMSHSHRAELKGTN